MLQGSKLLAFGPRPRGVVVADVSDPGKSESTLAERHVDNASIFRPSPALDGRRLPYTVGALLAPSPKAFWCVIRAWIKQSNRRSNTADTDR